MQIRMIHNGRGRDSVFMPMDDRTVDLMLQYSIQLVRCEPTTHFNAAGTYCRGDGILHDEYGRFHLEAWTDLEWLGFRNNFVGIITRHWDRKFELVPNDPWYRPRHALTPPVPARITCSLSIGLVDTPPRANQRYFIVKPRETTFRSFASPEHRLGLFTHRDLSLSSSTVPTRVGRARHSVTFLQCTILHEFGHTLGLDHVNGAGNGTAAYGISLDDREDQMGLGDHLSARAARPWKSQLRHHLIPESGHREDSRLRFAAEVVAPQIYGYWDNDWVAPAAPPAP